MKSQNIKKLYYQLSKYTDNDKILKDKVSVIYIMKTYSDCELCGNYSFDTKYDTHLESIKHMDNLQKSLKIQRAQKAQMPMEDQVNLEKGIADIQKVFEEGEFECLNCGGEDGINDTKEEAMEHEKKCYQITSSLPKTKLEFPITLYSNATATCDICNKTYVHNTKLHPKYALTRHEKTCTGENKHILKNIKDFICRAHISDLKLINDLIKTFRE